MSVAARIRIVSAGAVIGMILVAGIGCGARPLGGQVRQEPAAPAAVTSEARDWDGARGLASDDTPSSRALSRDRRRDAPPGQPSRGGTERRAEEQTKRALDESGRMVIYDARYGMIVESVSESVKEVERMADRYEGFIESIRTSDEYRRADIVMRVPVLKFDSALKDVEKLGTVVNRSVSASDVTMQFNDIQLRFNTAVKVRERMYELLKRVEKVEERVKVLREISRLTGVIESFNSQMNYLRDKASLSTISMNLTAKVRDVSQRYISSPFRWIADLTYLRRSIFDNGSGLSYETPKGFFTLRDEYYEKKGAYLVQNAAGGVSMRLGVVENYPPADMKFWGEAVDIDFANRKYKIEKQNVVHGKNGVEFKQYAVRVQDDDMYVIAFAVRQDRIIVFEGYCDSQENYKKHAETIDKFIASVGYK